ncbi:MAG TPA: hypothetical protein VK807_08570 [Gemmatimonadaceae bacterium]|jgi:hypothetical protein|nr:hypothetical protein [Gemmatimonadaceae bacterium]HTD62447.1 hypothetical protein [Gemmatimonadaceae bacterium]
MLKYVILLVIGVCVGYGLGFQDAKQNDENVVARLVMRVGGNNRENVKTDVDAQMDKVDDAKKH